MYVYYSTFVEVRSQFMDISLLPPDGYNSVSRHASKHLYSLSYPQPLKTGLDSYTSYKAQVIHQHPV